MLFKPTKQTEMPNMNIIINVVAQEAVLTVSYLWGGGGTRVLMAPNSPENPSTVTSHHFSYMVKLLFLKGFRWAFRGLRVRR